MRCWLRFLLLLLIPGLMPMCSTLPEANPGDPLQKVLDHLGSNRISGKDYHGLIVVPVEIDGKNYKMVVDTGANATVLRRDSFRRNWSERPSVPIQPGAGSNIRKDVDMVRVHSLSVGGLNINDLNLVLMDMPQLGSSNGMPVDGLLGMNVLGMFPIVVDLQADTVTLLLEVPSDELMKSIHAQSLPVTVTNGHMLAQVMLGGVPVNMIIDTGATQTCLPDKDWKGPTWERQGDLLWLDVNGKKRFSSSKFAEVSSIRWGGVELSGIKVLLGSEFGLIGTDILSRGRILLDIRSQQAWWIPR